MPREDFDRDLRQLMDDLLLLGSMVEKAIARAVDDLGNGSPRRDLEGPSLLTGAGGVEAVDDPPLGRGRKGPPHQQQL